MRYDVIAWEPEAAETRPWEVALASYLDTQAAAGWRFVSMGERVVEVAHLGGMGGTVQTERMLMLVFVQED